MSQYVNFFIRFKDNFIPIADYSRNNMVYQIVNNYVPYEKITVLTENTLDIFYSLAKEKKVEAEEDKQKYERLIKEISSFNNSVDEKLDAIHEYNRYIQETEEEIQEAVMSMHFFFFLSEILTTQDSSELLYAGIEIGEPTIGDII